MLINELAETIALDGTWQIILNANQEGTIQVPGCWEAQGYSKTADGPAHYRLDVRIPAAWAGRRILLEFDAVSYACVVLCNGIQVGEHRGLWTPFAVDLSAAAVPGEDNRLEVVIYKPGQRYPVRSSLAGFLPDLATTFGGIWQPARLRAVEAGLDDVQVTADYTSQTIRVQCRAEACFRSEANGAHHQKTEWLVEAGTGVRQAIQQRIPFAADGKLDLTIQLPDVQMWSPEQPTLYHITVTLMDGERATAQFTRRTGLRKLTAQGELLLFNDRPVTLRGILSWGWEPERIAPYYTVEQARAEMRRVREMGFNLIKLCLFVPNQAYFDVADEEGMLVWVELPMWLPAVSADLRERAPVEYAEIVEGLRHHPSVALYSLGCELSQAVDARLLGQLDRAVRERVRPAGFPPQVLLCDNSGSGESYGGFEFDFADFRDYHPYYDLHYFEPLLDNWRRDWQTQRPWIFGEFCDADTFRDQEEITQANGSVRPWWLTEDNPVTAWRDEGAAALAWKERMEQAQAGFSMQEIIQVSHRQAYIIRKYTLEALRRRRGMSGYVITGLRDTPISTSGIWDDLGRAKWSPAGFRQINGEAVLCLDVGRRRQWRHGGDRPDRLDAHTFWAGDIARWNVILNSEAAFGAGARLDWTLRSTDKRVVMAGSGRLESGTPPGIPVQVGVIHCQMPAIERAVQLDLQVILSEGSRRVSNYWPVWVHPRPGKPPEGIGVIDPTGMLNGPGNWLENAPRFPANKIPTGVSLLVTTALEEPLWRFIRSGGRVLLLQQGDLPLPARRCPFWREAIKLFAGHRLWEFFPHQGFTDMQFFGLASDLAFDTARLPEVMPRNAKIQPILRRLDAREFHMSEYLFEARAGKGTLLACTLNLDGGQGAQPEGRRNVAGAAMLAGLVGTLIKRE